MRTKLKVYNIFFFLLIVNFSTKAQLPLKKLSFENVRSFLDLKKTTTGYYLTGRTVDVGAGGQDLVFVKLDHNLNQTLSTAIGGANFDEGRDIIEAADGYIMVGTSRTYGGGSKALWATKISFTGNIVWSKTYNSGPNLSDIFDGIQALPNGNFILSGFVNNGVSSGDFSIIEIDTDGNIIWSGLYSTSFNEYSPEILVSPSGSILIAGVVNGLGAGGIDLALIKLDQSKNVEWSKTIGWSGNEGDALSSGLYLTMHRNKYYLSAITNSVGAGSDDILFLKADTLGNVENSVVYGTPFKDQPRGIMITDDHEVFITAFSFDAASDRDLVIIKTDTNGVLNKVRGFDIGSLEEFGAIVHDPPELIVTGYTTGYSGSDEEAIIFRMSDELDDCGQDTIPGFSFAEDNSQVPTVSDQVWTVGTVPNSVNVSPSGSSFDPVSNTECIEELPPCPFVIYQFLSPNGDSDNATFFIENISCAGAVGVKIFNIWGELVYSSNQYSNEWDGDNLPDGNYIYNVTIQNQTYTGKLVLLR